MCFGGGDSSPASTYNPYPETTDYKGTKPGVGDAKPKTEDETAGSKQTPAAPTTSPSTGLNNTTM